MTRIMIYFLPFSSVACGEIGVCVTERKSEREIKREPEAFLIYRPCVVSYQCCVLPCCGAELIG